ncbi:T9SS type A sorting domain-containing protein [Hymenobacter rubripertinctus]|uniref:T9SS C-terminal target domain-containing protein n=1 Tax=Hymenobacter rubripertinctus TaxID=2029981 RepID=A0A418QZ32_9BACT|nr:T9SS type A sorting domain-containing protein [Hymenobacter rubripertinctus]RIY10412.1 T9SS C-terminal target domain-containing protein [Hymenobacter rubripertinctus]
MFSRFFLLNPFRLLLLLGGLLPLVGHAQLALPSANPISETFASLASSSTASLPAGFQLANGTAPVYGAAANTAAVTQAAGTSGTGAITGSSTGGAYNFAPGLTASATDRALGFLSSSGYPSPRHILLALKNTSGTGIASLQIAFDIEKYRSGTRAFSWQCYTSRDGTTWTEETAASESFAADGANAVVNPVTTSSKSVTLNNLNLPDGELLYLRWSYVGSGGSTNGQGLALDNLVLTPTLSSTPPTPTVSTGTIIGSPFCVPAGTGTAVAVPFTSTGLTGTFSAQLSSATGSFSADLSQNSIGTGTASPVAATLPAGTAAGTGYRVRVVHVASATAGSDNGQDLVVTAPPASNSITVSPAGSQSLTTTGTGATLTATPEAPSTYAWAYGTAAGGPFSSTISTATAASYVLQGSDFAGAGTYYLVARATSTCGGVVGTSAPVTVTVAAPAPELTVSPLTLPDFGTFYLGTASGSQSVSLSGRYLTQPVTVTPPAGFEVRTGSGAFAACALTFTPQAGTLTATTFDVRFVPTVAQIYADNIAVTTTDKPSQAPVAVSGTGLAPVYPATLTTATPSNLTATTATAGGSITADGGSAVTERGVVYALNATPTLADNSVVEGSGSVSFSVDLSQLQPASTYYVRAYAVNAAGTVYGNEKTLQTLSLPLAAEPTTSATLTATDVSYTSLTLTLNGGDGSKHLVLATAAPDLTAAPTDRATYVGNPAFGQGDQLATGVTVLQAGTARSIAVTGLQPATEYTFAVFEYNDDDTAGAENYLLLNPGKLTLVTPAMPAQLLVEELFNYPAGDRLTNHGWTAHSGAGSNPILVSATTLTRGTNRPAAGSGAAELTATGEDVNRSFTAVEADTPVYASLLVNVRTANSADYFFHLGPSPLGTTYRVRLLVKAAATSGKVQFGVSGSGATPVYAAAEYDVNMTYQLVMRYVFGPAGTETRLYVNPPATEPTTPDATTTDAASLAPGNIGSVALRQGSNQSPMTVDELRVATAYSLVRPTASAPLPVQLTSFTAVRQNAFVQLRWQTAQELHARAFRVQRSTDGRTFGTVATVAAAGTSNQAHSYATQDVPPVMAGAIYYRLEQVDEDGTLAYSSVVLVGPATSAATVVAAPNPVTVGAPVHLTVTGRAGQLLQLTVLDNLGRVQVTQAFRPATNAAQVPLTLPATLPAGVYVVRITGGEEPLQTRLLLIR